ncbi:methylenetetrahydrofolate--tRNA-(uracil(54)-C(5))-methyltransferase (FADH(2)-oxidizing) TrmFO [bacterium]|nr:methylenetetrahydrofolate--tRNA-(uracil(54)-C(5))-methyltransferase (FADH(2)-oxidizing) TrmFO [bacterium]
MEKSLIIIGGGLAGCEAAWQAASRGIKVILYEMRPKIFTPAHRTPYLAELVCSNSLKSTSLTTAGGLLKVEMKLLNSLIIQVAEETKVPAGEALAVDREIFSQKITSILKNHPLIEIVNEEVTQIPDEPAIIATGPLTSPSLSEEIKKLTGKEYLYFYDAVSPIVYKDSIDFSKVFIASRYDKGEPAYINCPMNEEEYLRFYNALITAEQVPLKPFEEPKFFSACMPIEEIAKKDVLALTYGPLKPVGLEINGRRPFAVLQLRREDVSDTLYSMVGCQTRLTYPEQRRVFRLIPGLEQAEFARYGKVHRNTYILSPLFLEPTFRFKGKQWLFFAGQITGVEGYIESAASGLIAGINAARLIKGLTQLVFPKETMMGALANYISSANPENFQPMNANFGLLPPLEIRIRDKRKRYQALVERALQKLKNFLEEQEDDKS